MARIFISYSHKDVQFLNEFRRHFRWKYCCDSLWYDGELEGGDEWWAKILDEISRCDLFVYLVSEDSLKSEFCIRECIEALRLEKKFLPIIVRPRTNYPTDKNEGDFAKSLAAYQCIDMSKGWRDKEAIRQLDKAIDANLPKRFSFLSASSFCKLAKIIILLIIILTIVASWQVILIILNQATKPLPEEPWITVNLSAPVQDQSIFITGNSSWRFEAVFDTENEISAGIATKPDQQDWSDYSVLEMQIYPQQALDGCLAQLYIKLDGYKWANGGNYPLESEQWNLVTIIFSQMVGDNRRPITPNLDNIHEYGWKIFCPIGDTHTVSFNIDDIHLTK